MKKLKFLFIGLFSLALTGCTIPGLERNLNAFNQFLEMVEVTPAKHTVTFLNYDNSVLYKANVEDGMSALYQGLTPTKPNDGDKVYTFIGWDKPIGEITSDLTVIALFSESSNDSDPSLEYGLTKQQKMMFLNGSNVADNSYDSPYGVGRSINVISDKYIEISNRYNQIFDSNKLVEKNWIKTNIRQQEAQTISEDSALKFQESLISSYARKINMNAGLEGIFTSDLHTDFNISSDFHVNVDSHEIVTKLFQNVNGYSIEIEGYNDYRTFRSILSEQLLQDIADLQEGKLSTDEFFTFYGTHVVMAGYYGGRIECNYHLMFDDSTVDDDKMATYKTSCANALKTLFATSSESNNGNINIKNQINSNIIAKHESFTFKGRGGKYISGTTQAEFAQNYSSWINGFGENETSYSVLVDVPDRALMPIWNLFPTEYSDAATMIQDAFLLKSNQSKSDFIDQSTYIFDSDLFSDNVNFAGGAGTENSPYLCTNVNHLLKIADFMDSYFEIVNDIDISIIDNWEPLGGRNLEKAFTGHLNGKGNKIIGLKRKSGVPEKNSRSYFGFFGFIGDGGVVENIDFTDIDVAIRGPASDNSGMRAFFGVIAGKSMGTISNVRTYGKVNYSCCTNGETWMGGLVGYAVNSTISNCEVYTNLHADRYTVCVGGFVGYSQGGKIEYNKTDCSIEAIGTDWGGVARASLVGGSGHKSSPTLLVGNDLNGTISARAYDNSSWFTNCSINTSTDDFAYKFDTTY